MAGRKPDYNVHAMDKRTNAKARIGGAWVNPNGSISIVLNHFVVLEGNIDLVVTMFPNDRDETDREAKT